MIKILLSIVFVLCCTVFLTACGASVKLLEESNEEQRVEDIIAFCKKQYGDDVTVEFDRKEDLSVATGHLDGPDSYRTVSGGYLYHYYVTPSQYPDLRIEVTYQDGYILKKNFKKTEKPAVITSLYRMEMATYEVGLELADSVHQYDPGAEFTIVSHSLGQYLIITHADDFDTICDMRNDIYALLKEKKADDVIDGLVGVIYTDNRSITTDSIDFSSFPGLGSNGGKWLFDRFVSGEYDRFAAYQTEETEDMRDFFESRANMESTWITKNNTDNVFAMRTDYENYRDIVFFETISAREKKNSVSWEAWGLYD